MVRDYGDAVYACCKGISRVVVRVVGVGQGDCYVFVVGCRGAGGDEFCAIGQEYGTFVRSHIHTTENKSYLAIGTKRTLCSESYSTDSVLNPEIILKTANCEGFEVGFVEDALVGHFELIGGNHIIIAVTDHVDVIVW